MVGHDWFARVGLKATRKGGWSKSEKNSVEEPKSKWFSAFKESVTQNDVKIAAFTD